MNKYYMFYYTSGIFSDCYYLGIINFKIKQLNTVLLTNKFYENLLLKTVVVQIQRSETKKIITKLIIYCFDRKITFLLVYKLLYVFLVDHHKVLTSKYTFFAKFLICKQRETVYYLDKSFDLVLQTCLNALKFRKKCISDVKCVFYNFQTNLNLFDTKFYLKSNYFK